MLNRAIGRARLFRSEKDYAALERVLFEARKRFETPVLAWCVLPNYSHLVVWPRKKEELSHSSIKLLHRRVEANPDDSVAWLQLGLLYTEQRRLGKAVDAYGLVIELGQHRAYLQRAEIYRVAGMRKEAIGDFEESLKFDPKQSGVLNNLAWVLATAPEAELRDGKRARKLALNACDLTNYQQAHIVSTLAAAYAECGDFESARNWSRKLVELADDSVKESLRRERENTGEAITQDAAE